MPVPIDSRNIAKITAGLAGTLWAQPKAQMPALPMVDAGVARAGTDPLAATMLGLGIQHPVVPPPVTAPNINNMGGVGSAPYGPPIPAAGATNSAATTAGATGPMTYEQALAMARKMMGEAGVGGGADTAPIDAAIKAAQNTAATSSKQAKGNSARTQSDLAMLYGRLGNYVKGLLTGEQAANTQAQSQVGSSYDHLMATDAANAAHGQAGVAGELARLGLGDQAANANMNASQDAQHIAEMLGANKTSTLGNMKANATGAENVLRDMRSGAATYGTGLVGQAKVAGQNELANIATALQNQIGGLNAQKASLKNSSGSQALSLAMQLLNKQGGGTSPLQQSQIDKNSAETQKILAGLLGGSAPGSIPSKQGYSAAESWLQNNAAQSHLPTLMNLLHTAELGGATNKSAANHYKFDLTDPTLGKALSQSITARSKQGYNDQDLGALMTAVRIALNKA